MSEGAYYFKKGLGSAKTDPVIAQRLAASRPSLLKPSQAMSEAELFKAFEEISSVSKINEVDGGRVTMAANKTAEAVRVGVYEGLGGKSKLDEVTDEINRRGLMAKYVQLHPPKYTSFWSATFKPMLQVAAQFAGAVATAAVVIPAVTAAAGTIAASAGTISGSVGATAASASTITLEQGLQAASTVAKLTGNKKAADALDFASGVAGKTDGFNTMPEVNNMNFGEFLGNVGDKVQKGAEQAIANAVDRKVNPPPTSPIAVAAGSAPIAALPDQPVAPATIFTPRNAAIAAGVVAFIGLGIVIYAKAKAI